MTRRRSQGGFTLIELMIALVVAVLLASVAIPSYRSQVAKGRRADAKQALLELAQRMERFYTERGTYVGAALGAAGIYPTVSTGGYYTLTIVTQTVDGFTLTAAPAGNQAGDACGTYGYNQIGDQSVSGGSMTAGQCW